MSNITPVKTYGTSPPRILVHGGEKVGKSTFCAGAPRPIFLPTEEGLKGLHTTALVEQGKQRLETYGEFDGALAWAENPANQAHYDTIVIDSGDWLEALIHSNICATYGKTNVGECAGGFGKGYSEALEYWRHILLRLDRLNQAGKWIVIILHSKSVLFNDPTTEPYDMWTIKLHSSKNQSGSLELLKEWADIIAFACVEQFVSETKTTLIDKDQVSNRMVSTGKRQLHLENSNAYLAGNRYGMSGTTDLTWPAFMAKFSQTPTV